MSLIFLRVTDIMANRLIKPLQRTNWSFRLLYPKIYHEMVSLIEVMHKFTRTVIEERRGILEKEISQGTYRPCK